MTNRKLLKVAGFQAPLAGWFWAPHDSFIADGGEEDLVVFGEVVEGYQEAHLRHYRFCRCFSVACAEGELGDVHVSTILAVVSRAFFEAMRQEGWQMEAGQRPRSSCRKKEGGGSAASDLRGGHGLGQAQCACAGGPPHRPSTQCLRG